MVRDDLNHSLLYRLISVGMMWTGLSDAVEEQPT